jgi:hypothetical protein
MIAPSVTVRVTVNPGRVVHVGAHAFPAGDTLAVPEAQAAEMIAAGSVRREGEPEPVTL